MKKIIFLGLTFISTGLLNAQEVITCNGKQVTIQGPVCFTKETRGITLEYHFELTGETLYGTIIGKNTEDGTIREITVSKVPVKSITEKTFKIETVEFEEMFATTIAVADQKVAVTDYEKSGVENYTESRFTIYFSTRQALLDFIDRIKKQRGY